MDLLVKLLVAGGVMGVMDFMWLKFVASGLYREHLGEWLLDKPNMNAALAFYTVYVVGVVLLVVNPALEKGSLAHAVGYGALLGFMAYATFCLTNMAVFKGFTLKVILPDMIWGAVLTATMAGVTYLVVSKWLAA